MRFWRILTLLLVVAVAGINLWRMGADSFQQAAPPAASPVVSLAARSAAAAPAVFAVGYAWLIGSLLTGLLWPRRGEPGLVICVGAGIGLGLTAFIHLCTSRITAHPAFVVLPLELLLGCSLLFLWLRKTRSLPPPGAGRSARSWLGSLVRLAFAAGCIVALVALASSWPAGTDPPSSPPLVSAGAARIGTYAGSGNPFAAGLLPAAFTLATVGLLVAGVDRLRNRLIALAGGLVLLATPGFVRFAPGTPTDIPLGYFLLTATVLVSIARDEGDSGILFLAGLSAGLAAWAGQAGLLFCTALGLVFGISQLAARRWRNLPPLLGGLALTLVPLFLASLPLAGERAGSLTDWSRYQVILTAWWRDLPRFGEWYSLPFLVMALHLIGPGRGWFERRTVVAAALLLLLLAGCFILGLLRPVDFSSRFLQVWPVAVFLWCLLAVRAAPAAGQTSPAAAPADSAPSGR